ncbi:MAG: recombinase family protein [Pseudomonadota bacterium]
MSKGKNSNKVRCAIYTRKSSEDGLEQDFNSLDAQREACEAYIRSQKHEGWVALAAKYDDGGISGGTLDRPALARLLDDVRSGLVNQIVVYKIDRLTRSLSDFAKLVETLDDAGASFVSVTQSFNTSTSMGRLTLNVLLSFAQFEREVTAERIRDKIAASKKKGLWMGGAVPLGYRADGRTLVPVEHEAEIVRALYALYLECGSLTETVTQATKRHILRPARGSLRRTAGTPFERSNIHYILTNPIYTGQIKHRDVLHDGQHPAIIDAEVWAQVQNRLAATGGSRSGDKIGAGQNRARQNQEGQTIAIGGTKNPSPGTLLRGKLFDESGVPLVPHSGQKGPKRYRYYISKHLLRKTTPTSDRGWRVSAEHLEAQIVKIVAARLGELERQHRAKIVIGRQCSPQQSPVLGQHAAVGQTIVSARPSNQAAQQGHQSNERHILFSLIKRISLSDDAIELVFDRSALANHLGIKQPEGLADDLLHYAPLPMARRQAGRTSILGATGTPDQTLLHNIAKGRQCLDQVTQGHSLGHIAKQLGVSKNRVLQLINHAFLAPDIIRQVVEGTHPNGLTSQWLKQRALALDWDEQRRMVERL